MAESNVTSAESQIPANPRSTIDAGGPTSRAAEWIGTAEAAERLRVKPGTLYAYVSRGVLGRRRSLEGRSLFDAEEVEQLARRGRPRRQVSPSEFVIESKITALSDGRPYYRGVDSLELARSCSFEAVAEWLWTNRWRDSPASAIQTESIPATATQTPPAQTESIPAAGSQTPPIQPTAIQASPTPASATLASATPASATPATVSAGRQGRAAPVWRATREAAAAGRAAQSGLTSETLPLERLQVITTTLAATDPLRLNLDPSAVVAAGQNLIAGMVDCLPGESSGSTIADRLCGKLVRGPEAPGLPDVLRAALVLLADHELAASTLAARVAASVRADPYAVVTAGLGVLSGTLHGGASLGAEALLFEIRDPAQAARVVGERLRRGERVPGFGHPVYSIDRRASFLLERIRSAVPGHPRLVVAEAVLAEARRRRLPEVNIDFALATLADIAQMISGAGETIFAVARTAGWLAHAVEQYANPVPLRPRAVYTGPAPGAV